jgi:TonB family protein
MKTKLPLLLCILFLAGAVKAQTPSGIGPARGFRAATWPRFTIKGEEFSVALPRTPAMTTRKAPITGTNKNRKERVLQASAGGVDYWIYIYENPKPGQTLDEFIREQTASSAREVTNERALSINGFLGKEYSYRVNEKPQIEQFVVTEKRLYRLVATGAPADHAGVRQFFASLSLGTEGDGLAVEDGPGDTSTGPAEKIYTGREVHTKARLISKPEPSYTDAARNAEIEGTVVLRVVFAADGKVTNIRVVVGLPKGLTERSIEAARKIKFVPATIDERPVSMWMQLEYNWNLR